MKETLEREMVEQVWKNILTKGEEKKIKKPRHLMQLIPRNSRCRTCDACELLVSEEAASAAGIDVSGAGLRRLARKGRSKPVSVRVLNSL